MSFLCASRRRHTRCALVTGVQTCALPILWTGGLGLRRNYTGASVPALGRLAAGVVVATALCHLFAQGGFYWLSDSVAEPTFAGWAKNYGDWFVPYLRATAMFVAVAAIAQVVSEQVAAHAHPVARNQKTH